MAICLTMEAGSCAGDRPAGHPAPSALAFEICLSLAVTGRPVTRKLAEVDCFTARKDTGLICTMTKTVVLKIHKKIASDFKAFTMHAC